jgi:hypothetical protein
MAMEFNAMIANPIKSTLTTNFLTGFARLGRFPLLIRMNINNATHLEDSI